MDFLLSEDLLNTLAYQEYSGVSVAPPNLAVELIYGKPYIHESISDLRIRISTSSFFQVNTYASEVLYSIVRDWCNKDKQKTEVLDICCGTGTISLTLAPHVDHVTGIDIIEEAINDARENAQLNGICNATFITGKVETEINTILSRMNTAERNIVAIVNPPRAGLPFDISR